MTEQKLTRFALLISFAVLCLEAMPVLLVSGTKVLTSRTQVVIPSSYGVGSRIVIRDASSGDVLEMVVILPKDQGGCVFLLPPGHGHVEQRFWNMAGAGIKVGDQADRDPPVFVGCDWNGNVQVVNHEPERVRVE
jgi:hypothetical protein